MFELVAQLWNDSSFNPTAPASDCHSDYQSAVDCSYEVVAGLVPATPQRIEDVFTSMRSDLLRIISRWEQSGQGEGGMDNEEQAEDDNTSMASSSSIAANEASPCDAGANMGCLSGRPSRALQSRSAFLNGRPSYLLYFWEVADAHQLLVSSLQRLSSSTGATDASSAPSALSTARSVSSSGGGRRRRQQGRFSTNDDDERDERLFVPLAESIKDLADSQRDMLNARSEDRQHERELEERRSRSEREVQEQRSRSEREVQEQRSRSEREVQEQRIHSEVTENCRKRRAELQDLARQYRRHNAELGNASDERSRLMSEFYIREGELLQDEIRQLECNDSNNV